MENNIIRIKRKVMPGRKSLSGRTYGIYEYNNAIEKSKDKIKNEELEAEIVVGLTDKEYMDMLIDQNHGIKNIDKGNTCGTIVAVGDNYIDLKLNDDKNMNFVKSELATLEPVLKFSKLYALLKENNSSFTENQDSIQQLKQALEKLTAKLETLLTTMVKESKGFNPIFTKQNQGDALSYLQGVYARTLNGTTDKNVGLSENNPFMTMSKLEQFVLQTGANRQEVSQEQFIKAFENIIGRSKLTNLNGMQKLFIKLNPESLGTLRIELIQRDGILMAKIIASTSGGKQLLDAQLNGLKQAFINQNISVEKIEIAYQSSELNQERHFNQDNKDNDESFTNQNESNIASETEQFLNELEKALTNQEEEV